MALVAGAVDLLLQVIAIGGKGQGDFRRQFLDGLGGQFLVQSHATQQQRYFRRIGVDDIE